MRTMSPGDTQFVVLFCSLHLLTPPTAGPCSPQRVSGETRVIKTGLRAKSKESRNLRVCKQMSRFGFAHPRWATWDPERGNASGRSFSEGRKQRLKPWSLHSTSWRAAPTPRHSWPERHLLCRLFPHIPRGCLFQSRHHTQDGTSCAAKPLLHCGSVSAEMKVRAHVFTKAT